MKYILLALILTTFSSISEESPFKIRITELLAKTEQTDDLHYLSRATARCSGLISLMHAVFTRDVPGTDFSSLEDESYSLFETSFKIDLVKLKSRGGEPSKQSKTIMENIKKETAAHYTVYSKWFEKNFFEQGEYFGSSPLLQGEIKLCRQLASNVKL